MEYQITTIMTWEDWDEWRKTRMLYGKVSGAVARGVNRFLRLFGVALLILGGVMIVYGVMQGVKNTFTAIGVLCLPGGLLWTKKRTPRESLNNRKMAQYLKRQMPDQELCFHFTEAGFSVIESGETVSYTYTELTDLLEDSGRFYLLIEHKIKYILRKADFSGVDSADLRRILEEKSGKEIIFVQ